MKILIPPLLFLIILILMVLVHWFWSVVVFRNPVLTMIGIISVIAGLGVSFKANRHFAQVGTNINTFGNPDVLVTTGVFRFTRNPMYLGMSLALIGVACALGSLVPMWLALLFMAVCNYWYIPVEEARMLSVFGQQYIDYKNKTRRWF